MIKLYNKIDKNRIKKAPFHWILGWHKFLPIIAILILFSVAVGFIFPVRSYNHYRDNGLDTAAIFLGFVSFMAFILYVIRQIKFNSFRIHHHIPFKKHIVIFFSFWLLIFSFSIIPNIAHKAHNWRVKKHINNITDDFKADQKTLFKGSVFFASNSIFYPKNDVIYKEVTHPKDKYNPLDYLDVIFNEDNIEIKRVPNNFGYYFDDIKERRFPIKMDKKEAISRIEKFITVADKYDIKLTERNPLEIFNKRKAYNKLERPTAMYSLYTLKNMPIGFNNASNAYDGMMYKYGREMGEKITLKEILGYLLLSIIIASLLWIVISVPIEDFGFSILASVLIMILMGILAAMIEMLTHHDFYIRLIFYIMIIAVYFFAYFSNIKQRLKRILKIVSHYLVPVFMFLITLEIDEANIFDHSEEFIVFSLLVIIGILISNFIFTKVYKDYRLLPK